MPDDKYDRIAEAVHDRWCRANLDHPTERMLLANALREAAAEAWLGAAHIVAPDGDPGTDELRELAQIFFDRAAPKPTDAGGER